MKARVALLACAAAGLSGTADAVAAEATGGRVRALAQRAQSDPAALAELRRIDVVDGRPVDLDAALSDASSDELARRLDALARSGGGGAEANASARDDARRILSERRFRESEVPRPFEGFLEWVRDTFGFVGRPFEWLADRMPGGPRALWIAIGALALVAAVLFAQRTAERRGGRNLEVAQRRRRAGDADPGVLDRQADEAERRGDLDAAVRLRFRAGVLRLGQKEVIPRRESLTTGQIRRLVRLAEFDRLARDHDEIAYGARPAGPEDAEAARSGWPVVVAKAAAP